MDGLKRPMYHSKAVQFEDIRHPRRDPKSRSPYIGSFWLLRSIRGATPNYPVAASNQFSSGDRRLFPRIGLETV